MKRENIIEMFSYYKYIPNLMKRADMEAKIIALSSFLGNSTVFKLCEEVFLQSEVKRKLQRQKEFIEIIFEENCTPANREILKRLVLDGEKYTAVSADFKKTMRTLQKIVQLFLERSVKYLVNYSDEWYEKRFKCGRF